MNDTTVFSTRDLPLAATLVTLKFFMIGIDLQLEGQKNQPVGYFKFEDSQLLQDAKQKYNQGLISVEPKVFLANLRGLKSDVVNQINQID
ncbi:MAG: hypothetical protein WCX46_04215 [Candidatus Paceibacterota bacterium]